MFAEEIHAIDVGQRGGHFCAVDIQQAHHHVRQSRLAGILHAVAVQILPDKVADAVAGHVDREGVLRTAVFAAVGSAAVILEIDRDGGDAAHVRRGRIGQRAVGGDGRRYGEECGVVVRYMKGQRLPAFIRRAFADVCGPRGHGLCARSHRQILVSTSREARRVVHRQHRQIHRGGVRAPVEVRDRVGKAVATVVIRLRCVGVGTVGIQYKRAVRGLGVGDHGDVKAVQVAVVVHHSRRGTVPYTPPLRHCHRPP